MSMPEIYIFPIKALLSMTDFPENTIAIINSSEPVNTEALIVPHCAVCYQDLDYESPRSFTPELAQQIANFVRKHRDPIHHIFVCCQAAQSRSPGIAAALYTYYGLDPLEIFSQPQYHPNVLCYRLLTEAFGIQIQDYQIDTLLHANDKAFKNALAKGRRP